MPMALLQIFLFFNSALSFAYRSMSLKPFDFRKYLALLFFLDEEKRQTFNKRLSEQWRKQEIKAICQLLFFARGAKYNSRP